MRNGEKNTEHDTGQICDDCARVIRGKAHLRYEEEYTETLCARCDRAQRRNE